MYAKEKENSLYRQEAKHTNNKFELMTAANRQRDFMVLLIFLICIASILIIMTLIIFRNKKLNRINKKLSEKNEIIEKQKEELSLLNSTKDKFFSIIAHDLKNPLGSFKMMTSALRNSFFSFTEDDRIEFLDLMKDSAENVYSLLENLLDWSRSQRGTIEFKPVEFDFYTVVTNTITTVKSSADNKQITIINEVQENTLIYSDINMLTTIVRNLLTNAIKFTYEQGIVCISYIKDEKNFIFKVTDSGIGMSETKLNQLFRIDAQISTNGTNNERGTGLGLILCKEFIERHGGSITVESELGKGSTFTCTIPLIK